MTVSLFPQHVLVISSDYMSSASARDLSDRFESKFFEEYRIVLAVDVVLNIFDGLQCIERRTV